MAKGLFNQELPKQTKRSRFGFAHPDTEAIYCAYPKLRAPGRAEKAIEKALKEIAADLLLAKVKAYAQSVKDDPPKYIPHPATWFNDRRWLDVVAKPKASYHDALARQSAIDRAANRTHDAKILAERAEFAERMSKLDSIEQQYVVRKAFLRMPVELRRLVGEDASAENIALVPFIREVLAARDSAKGENGA